MGVSAQLKAFIDRCQAFWARKYILNLPIREGGRIANGFLSQLRRAILEKDYLQVQ